MSRSPENPDCSRTLERLEAFLDRQLTVDVAQEIGAHLEFCETCRAELELAESIRAELRRLPQRDAPDHVLASIIDQTTRPAADQGLMATLQKQRDRRLWAGLAAAGLVLLIATFTLVREDDRTSPDAAAVAQATAEARYALERAGLLTRQAGFEVRDRALLDHLVVPATRSLDRSLRRQPVADPGRGATSGDTDQGVDDA